MTDTVNAAPPAPASTGTPVRRRTVTPTRVWQLAGPFAVFAILFAVVAILTPGFVGGNGLVVVAQTATATLLVALAQAIVLHVGSIDLSNAAMALFSAILLAKMLGPIGPVAPILAILIVGLVGAVNGWLVAYTQVPSFALTLGMLGILQAASLVVSDSTTVYVEGNGETVTALYENAVAGLPMMFWVAVLLAVLLWALLRFTVVGQSLTAIGLNESGALFAGIRTRPLKVAAFAISGVLAGFAGMMIIAQSGSASSTGLGSDLLLPAIASAIVGGTAITGGITNPINVVFGALTVSLIPIGAAAIGIPPEAQSLVYGLVIIVVVALTTTRGRGVVK
ncbi:ABC transporter permease [Nakamurella endophytica]|uniref:ABC transporter permease n=1 Tax=Nakamurella endophytica TaxID=1748367 RepID=UPI00166DD42C|nr:ABC transporter permease [Nakamurella endophytica]